MEEVYPFPNEDIEDLLGELLEKHLLELPEPKKLDEVDKVDHPKFCKYHWMTNHKTVDCFVLKEKIQALIDDGTIKLVGNQTAENKATADVNLVFAFEKQEWLEITTRKKRNKKSNIEYLSEIIERTQWLEDHIDEFSDFSDWSENTFDEEEEAERLMAIYNVEVLQRVGLRATREELAERGQPWTFLIEPSLPENSENTPWDEEGTSYVSPPYAHLDGDPNNPSNHFVADQDEMKRDENQIDSQSKVASCHMVRSIEEEHDETEEKDTPKEEAVEQTSNKACPIQLRSGKQLSERTTQVGKKSKEKAVEGNEFTSVQSQQGAKKVVNEKPPTKYDVLAHLKKIQAPLSDFVNMISGEEQDVGKEDEELVNEPEEAPPSLEDGSR
ncbi:hypothetical protein MRB53_028656 [Persea americana]|uniref:Uncharacterized protein n=1 Tax=Persea americana TaxID=3435 RepID=A0ACC2KG50_PERAE|nr:hypothetical protein MRB53_028656 [Persea americana]